MSTQIESVAGASGRKIESPAAANVPAAVGPIRKLLFSLGLWYLYVPHLWLLRLAGPRVAVRISRLTAWGHWALALLGAGGTTRRAIQRVRGELDTSLPTATILRKHLEVKHYHFTVWSLATTKRGRDFILRSCRRIDGEKHLHDALAQGRGVIVLAYHFGTGRMVSVKMDQLFRSEGAELGFRPQTYWRHAYRWVARLAQREAVRVDEQSGLKLVNMTSNRLPLPVLRALRNGKTVGMAGDGFFAEQRLEMPFLGCTLSFPVGVARLSAMTGAKIVTVFGLSDSLETHHIEVHPPIQCESDTPEAIEATMRQCISLLESYVRRYPWAWWPWHRLEFDPAQGKKILIEPAPLEAD